MDSLANDNIAVDRSALWHDDHAAGLSAGRASKRTLRRASGLDVRFEGEMPQMALLSRQRLVALAVKRGMDVVLGTLALVALSPLLIATGVIIRATSKGPALFRQNRDGLNGRVISVFKFRSMYTDLGDRTGVAQTLRNDPRITPIGRFIRKTSIDELPQLLNVIRGDMSLIGPRPHPIGMMAGGVAYDKLVPYYHFRHRMKPGISGWAQANGLRGPSDDASLAVARIDHDVAYVQHFGIMLDIKIILKTLRREFLSGSGL
jgi:polysaccharide biosynthesis protein PslA